MAFSRRHFLKAAGIATASPMGRKLVVPGSIIPTSAPNLSITGIAVHTIKVNQRGNWYFVELQTNKGISGLGEASHGFTATTKNGEALLKSEIAACFELVKGESLWRSPLASRSGEASRAVSGWFPTHTDWTWPGLHIEL